MINLNSFKGKYLALDPAYGDTDAEAGRASGVNHPLEGLRGGGAKGP